MGQPLDNWEQIKVETGGRSGKGKAITKTEHVYTLVVNNVDKSTIVGQCEKKLRELGYSKTNGGLEITFRGQDAKKGVAEAA